MRTATTRARTAPRASTRLKTRARQRRRTRAASTLAEVMIGLALAAVAPGSAMASAAPRPVAIHVRDTARYPLSYVRRVQRAVQYQVNHQLHRIWHTPLIAFDAPSAKEGAGNSWLVDVTPQVTVMYGFFTRANGFHLPDSPVYIAVAGRAKTMPMSLILSHEVIEALVDPRGDKMTDGLLTEVCDPVELPGYLINGIAVSNFVTPRWFTKSAVSGKLDFERLLTSALTTTPEGFLPGSTSAGGPDS